MKKALITGITGQDGSHLTDLLLSKDYEVHGLVRRVALEDPKNRMSRLLHALDKVEIHAGSMESYASLLKVIQEVKPDEVYHLAAQSFVSYSFEDDFSTIGTNIFGTLYLLFAIRSLVPEARFYFAGSSEMFGNVSAPQSETTPFQPRSPYGVSKLAGYHLMKNYREAYGMFCSGGILFNHCGPRRGSEFVERKITKAVARIVNGDDSPLLLGNLDARRDWGYAPEYVEAMWRMLQQEKPDDFVIATGETHSIRTIARWAFGCAQLNWEDHVQSDPLLFRPAEIHELRGDWQKAHELLGWAPNTTLPEIIDLMVKHDITERMR